MTGCPKPGPIHGGSSKGLGLRVYQKLCTCVDKRD